MIRILLAVLALVALASNAEARQRHKATGLHPSCNVLWPCEVPSASTPQAAREARGRYFAREMGFGGPVVKPHRRVPQARRGAVDKTRENSAQVAQEQKQPSSNFSSYSIGRPGRYIAGRLICAVNVGAALAERGIKGTGSALALSYLHWGHSAGGPVPGAVIVSARRGGGHVAIVSRVENGIIYAWNATGGQSGWREIPYRHHIIDFRVPG